MDLIARNKLLAKREMQTTLAKLQALVRKALPKGSFGSREEAALAICEETVRGVLLLELTSIARGLGAHVVVDGVAYRQHESGMGHYASLNGRLDVSRKTYREVGVRNGPTIVPLELVAGLVEGATPAMAYNVADGYARCDMRQHGEALTLAHRVPPPRATLERLAKRIAKEVDEVAPRVESVIRRGEKLPEGTQAVVMGLDRTSAPMAEARPAGASSAPKRTRRAARARRAPDRRQLFWPVRRQLLWPVRVVLTAGRSSERFRGGAGRCPRRDGNAARHAGPVAEEANDQRNEARVGRRDGGDERSIGEALAGRRAAQRRQG